jgi:hypothetical protein
LSDGVTLATRRWRAPVGSVIIDAVRLHQRLKRS